MTNIHDITKDFEDWIDQYLNFEKHPQKNIFWLDTMRFFCSRAGHPELASRAIHIAGSKGKGSVSAFVSSILSAAGYKTALYTSPHILDFAERVRAAEGFFDEKIYRESAEELKNLVRSVPDSSLPAARAITWFELVTMYAFLCFRRYRADWSVYEVGLGGRLDATNVVKSEVSCITTLELEHTEFLGNTIEEIAHEKGGIIKENTPVILTRQCDEAFGVIKQIAAERNARLVYMPDVISNMTQRIVCDEQRTAKMNIMIDSPLFSRKIESKLRLLGEVQLQNAATAAVISKFALPTISEDDIERGLERAFLPARFEVISSVPNYPDIPYLIIDGAHTVKSVSFLLNTLCEYRTSIFAKANVDTKLSYLLFACAADKDVEDMAHLLCPNFSYIAITRPGDVKTADMKRAVAAFSAGDSHSEIYSNEDYASTIEAIFTKANSDRTPLVVCGSFYLAAEVKKKIFNS